MLHPLSIFASQKLVVQTLEAFEAFTNSTLYRSECCLFSRIQHLAPEKAFLFYDNNAPRDIVNSSFSGENKDFKNISDKI